MREALAEVWLYPDGNGHDLKAALASRHGVRHGSGHPGQWFQRPHRAAGRSFPHAAAVGGVSRSSPSPSTRSRSRPPEPVARGHRACARLRDALRARPRRDARAHRRTARASSTSRTRTIPTGSWNTEAQVVAFLERVPQSTLVVLDEAYFEYARAHGCPDGVTLIRRFPNLVVLRTFSKAHALAGVRIGYAVSHPEVADVLNRVRQPFNAGIPALVGAEASLGDPEQVARAVRARHGRTRRCCAAQLPTLGVKCYESAGNFVLADVGESGQRRSTNACCGTVSSCGRWAATDCHAACASPSAPRSRMSGCCARSRQACDPA